MSEDVICYNEDEATAFIAAAIRENHKITISIRPLSGYLLVTLWSRDAESPT
jgi:hypothetical protein